MYSWGPGFARGLGVFVLEKSNFASSMPEDFIVPLPSFPLLNKCTQLSISMFADRLA